MLCWCLVFVFFFKQKTAYEMRISDWSSDVCSSDLGITVSAALWGTLVGALFAGKPGDAFGSRDSLRVLAILYYVAGLGCALAPGWTSFLVFRFICGLAIGGSSVLAPVYIAAIVPPRHRGFLVGLFSLLIITGILVAYLSNATIAGLVEIGRAHV